jgi:hypothetical protein
MIESSEANWIGVMPLERDTLFTSPREPWVNLFLMWVPECNFLKTVTTEVWN